MSIPLLIVSDAPSAPTGLGRITRDLAVRIHAIKSSEMDSTALHLPQFRVATLGIGGDYTRALSFPQYRSDIVQGLIPNNLPSVWRDLTGDSSQRGIIFAIGNPTWLTWLSHPESLPGDSELRRFLAANPFEKWLYAPIDGDGPGERLPSAVVEALQGWDRVLAYNEYGAKLIDQARGAYIHSGIPATPHLPHGIDTTVFYPRPRAEARATFLQRIAGAGQPSSPFTPDAKIDDDMLLIGIVGTNSERKDWYLGMETCHHLLTTHRQNVVLWGHTNTPWKNWDIPALARDFGLSHRLVLTTRNLSNDDLAWSYSACDATLAIGAGGGWEFPIAESIACYVPVIHGNYAGGACVCPKEGLIDPITFHGNGFYGIRRPVFDPRNWADRVMKLKDTPVELPAHMDWKNAWEPWQDWLLKGLDRS